MFVLGGGGSQAYLAVLCRAVLTSCPFPVENTSTHARAHPHSLSFLSKHFTTHAQGELVRDSSAITANYMVRGDGGGLGPAWAVGSGLWVTGSGNSPGQYWPICLSGPYTRIDDTHWCAIPAS